VFNDNLRDKSKLTCISWCLWIDRPGHMVGDVQGSQRHQSGQGCRWQTHSVFRPRCSQWRTPGGRWR